jgi:hypothetical protein
MRPGVEGNIFGLSRVNGHHASSSFCVSRFVFATPFKDVGEVVTQPLRAAEFVVRRALRFGETDTDVSFLACNL